MFEADFGERKKSGVSKFKGTDEAHGKLLAVNGEIQVRMKRS